MPRSIAGLVLSAPPRPANGSCFTPRAHPHPAPQPRCRCRCLRSSPLRPGPARTGAAAFFFHPPPSTFPRCRGAAGRAGTRSRCPGTGEGEPQRGGHRSRSRSSSGLGSSPGRGKKKGETASRVPTGVPRAQQDGGSRPAERGLRCTGSNLRGRGESGRWHCGRTRLLFPNAARNQSS